MPAWISILIFVLTSRSAFATTYNSRCSLTTNDIENLETVAFRLSLCPKLETRKCEELVETSEGLVPKGKKAFNTNIHFKFFNSQIDEIIKKYNWDPEKVYVEYGTLRNKTYRAYGARPLPRFLEGAKRSVPFASLTIMDENTGKITVQSCEVVNAIASDSAM